jgi:hypothetical protein
MQGETYIPSSLDSTAFVFLIDNLERSFGGSTGFKEQPTGDFDHVLQVVDGICMIVHETLLTS